MRNKSPKKEVQTINPEENAVSKIAKTKRHVKSSDTGIPENFGIVNNSVSNPFKKITILGVVKILILISYALLIFISAYHIYFGQRIIPGVYIGKMNVGGMTYAQAKDLLSKQEENVLNELALKYNDKIMPIKTEEIGLRYDWESGLSQAFKIGRSGNILNDSNTKLKGFVATTNVESFYSYDSNALSSRFSQIKGELNVEPQSSKIEMLEGFLKVTESKRGQKVLEDELYKIVMNAFDGVDFSPKEIPVRVVEPKIVEKDIRDLVPAVEKSVSTPITILYFENAKDGLEYAARISGSQPAIVADTKDPKSQDGEKAKDTDKDTEGDDKKETKKSETQPAPRIIIPTKKWEVDREQMVDFIGFDKDEKGKVEIGINEAKFRVFADTITYEVNRPPKGKVTETDGNEVINFEIIEPGYEVDVDKLKEDFEKALFDDGKNVYLALKETEGKGDKEKYGIISLIGEGSSNFTGSIQGRINNLTLAASRTDGVLVPPGTVYSLNKTIGEISGRTGYDVAYIIQNGRTVLGEGGGVCQTSTTLFRAVLNSGLPVVKRYPHAYRVHYYEQDSGPGVDASIFQPSVDFQFKNDTPAYILIQTNWDLESKTLVFRFYGTPDGRVAEISKPIVTNQIAPPAPLYQDDPSLKKGVVRQVDWSAWGATASFSRVVKKDDAVLFEDTYTTRYQPWRAVYLRGTKED